MRDRKLRFSHTKIGHIVTTCAVIQNFLIKNGFDITDLPMVQEDVPTEPLRHQDDYFYSIGTKVRNTLVSKITRNNV